MKTYIYSGPVSGVTLNTPDGPLEVMLHPGKPVHLPEDNEYVRTLIAKKRLSEVPAEQVEEETHG